MLIMRGLTGATESGRRRRTVLVGHACSQQVHKTANPSDPAGARIERLQRRGRTHLPLLSRIHCFQWMVADYKNRMSRRKRK